MKNHSGKVVSGWFSSWSHSRALLCLFLLSSCGAPGLVPNTPEGKKAILDATHIALTDQNCSLAISYIEPLYNSPYTDNEVRMTRASAHGCAANINFFSVVNTLIQKDLSGPEFWQTMTEMFDCDTSDGRTESGWYATDALQAVLATGSVVTDDNIINSGSYNEGSTLKTQRLHDSNAYLIFVAMSIIGSLQNRYGSPNSQFLKTADLPWDTKANMDSTGCSYAGSILNMIDAIDDVSTVTSGSTANTLNTISVAFSTAMTIACSLGCQGRANDGTAGADADCTFSASDCETCPLKLRHRENCDSDAKSACAAAGIVRFVNDDSNGWQTGS